MFLGKLKRMFVSPLTAVMDAYRAADYELALRRCEALRSDEQPTAPYYFFRGGMLLQLGRFSEAESSLRQGLLLEESPRSRALVYSQLATVMLDQEKFSEALAGFDESIRICPGRGGSYRAIAEVRLRQGIELEQALKHAQRSVEMERKDTELNPDARNTNLSEALGVLAWAIAANGGKGTEVESILNAAFSLHDGQNVPMLAKLHYHAARAHLRLQADDKAKQQLHQASTLDPQGTFGRLAGAALAH